MPHRARAAPDARRRTRLPSRRTTTSSSTRACASSAWSWRPAARAAIDGHVRLLLAWTAAINLTAVRDPLAVATAHVLDSLAAVPVLRALGIDRFARPGLGWWRARACRWPSPCPRRRRAARRADRQEGALPGHGPRRRSGSRTGWRSSPARAEALAPTPDHRGRWPVVTARAVAPSRRARRARVPAPRPGTASWSPGSAATSTTSWRAARRAIEALGGGTLDVEPVSASRPSPGTSLVVVTPDRRRRPDASRATRACAAPAVVTATSRVADCYPDRRCGSPSCRTSTATSSPSTRSSPTPERSMRSGTSATSSATARIPTGSSPAWPRSAPSASAAITTRRPSAAPRSTGSTRRPARPSEWTARHDRARRPGPGWRPCPTRRVDR